LKCGNNQLSAAALNALFESLNDVELPNSRKYIDIANNPGTAGCQTSIAMQKHWTVAPDENYEGSGDPGILPFIAGIYRNSEDIDCRIFLNIMKPDDEVFNFTFVLLVNESEFRGKVTASAVENYIVLEGIPWVANLGALDEDGNPVEKNIKPAYGVDAYWEEGNLVIQNHGNVSNQYEKLDCDAMFITLIKE